MTLSVSIRRSLPSLISVGCIGSFTLGDPASRQPGGQRRPADRYRDSRDSGFRQEIRDALFRVPRSLAQAE